MARWVEKENSLIKQLPGGYLASIESECENDFVVELLGQTSGWTQTYLGATDLDTEGTWVWIKTGGSTFWEGGDPASGGAAVSGMYSNFFDAEPNNGAGGNSQNCLVIGVSSFSIAATYSTRKATGNGETSCAQRRVSSCVRRQPPKEEHPSLLPRPLLVQPLVRFSSTTTIFLDQCFHPHSSLSTTIFPSMFLHM